MNLTIKDIAEGLNEIYDDKDIRLSSGESEFVKDMFGLFKTFKHTYMTCNQRRKCLDLLEKYLILEETQESIPVLPREPEEFEVDLEELDGKDDE